MKQTNKLRNKRHQTTGRLLCVFVLKIDIPYLCYGTPMNCLTTVKHCFSLVLPCWPAPSLYWMQNKIYSHQRYDTAPSLFIRVESITFNWVKPLCNTTKTCVSDKEIFCTVTVNAECYKTSEDFRTVVAGVSGKIPDSTWFQYIVKLDPDDDGEQHMSCVYRKAIHGCTTWNAMCHISFIYNMHLLIIR